MVSKRITLAYGSIPKDGGTYTFYRNQRNAFASAGVDMFCVVLGKNEHAMLIPEYIDEGVVSLLPEETDNKLLTLGFLKWCENAQVDIIMAVNSIPILNSIPYLPTNIKVITRAANAFDEGYYFATYAKERINHFIALTPRLQWDLESKYNIPTQKITVIPNGINIDEYQSKVGFDSEILKSEISSKGLDRIVKPLKLIFVGRLEHNQKGVLYIPEILKRLKAEQIPFELSIVGKGRDEQKLRKKLQGFTSNEVRFLGMLNRDDVKLALQNSDVYIFLSHFEGCPNALLEAMVSGCVPVSWLIQGITDYLIENEETGFLCEMRDYDSIIKNIKTLHLDRNGLVKLKSRVKQNAQMRFSHTHCVGQYVRVFENALYSDKRETEYETHPLENYSPMPVYRPSVIDRVRSKLRRWKL